MSANIRLTLIGFGRHCYNIRKRRLMSRNVVSKKTGISMSTIARLEAGKQSVSFRAAIIIAMFYKISMDEVIGLD